MAQESRFLSGGLPLGGVVPSHVVPPPSLATGKTPLTGWLASLATLKTTLAGTLPSLATAKTTLTGTLARLATVKTTVTGAFAPLPPARKSLVFTTPSKPTD